MTVALIPFLCLALVNEASATGFFITADAQAELSLVRVNIITETPGSPDAVEINGKRITDYSPIIIQVFSSTGIVLDDQGHIMTFLGYHWVEIADSDPRIEIAASGGQKLKGKLIGTDQSSGVAVVRLLGGKLPKTPVCADGEVKDGATVIVPVWGHRGASQFHESQILSVGTSQGMPVQDGWTMRMSRPFPDIGLPVLTADHRILGFVASQDPMGFRTVVYPIARLLNSAEKILKKGGDIRAGWLGVFIEDVRPGTRPGVLIEGVEPDSPAQKAGLAADDFLVKFNGREIRDSREFIQLVQSAPIGSQATLDITRQGNPLTLKALIEARRTQPVRGRLAFHLPGAPDSGVEALMTGPKRLIPQPVVGLDTIVLTPSLANAMQIPRQSGLLVIDVAKQLPADLAGVLVGDIIVAMDGQTITDAASFASHLQTRTWGSELELKIYRKGMERTLKVHLPDPGR